MVKIQIKAVVFQEDGFWVARCLEYDIVCFADTLDELAADLPAQVNALVRLNTREGREPFHGFEKAPDRYWRMYEQGHRMPVFPEARKGWIERLRDFASRSTVETQIVCMQV